MVKMMSEFSDNTQYLSGPNTAMPDTDRKHYDGIHTLSSFMQTTPGHDYVDPNHSVGIAKVAVCMKGVSEPKHKEFRPDRSGLDRSISPESPWRVKGGSL